MASGRRPGKRSIVGSRVCAPLADGLLYPGVIESVQPSATDSATRTFAQQSYTVRFDADGSVQTFRESDVFGTGFQSVSASRLMADQTVYITHNGREVKGCIDRRQARRSGGAQAAFLPATDEPWLNDCSSEKSTCAWDEVWVLVDGEIRPLRRKVEEIRLMESRKSARLQQDNGPEIHHPHSLQSVIQPQAATSHLPQSLFGKSGELYSSQSEELMQFDNDYDDRDDVTMFDYNVDSSEHMDEHMAALVLTSLSCSPASPAFIPGGTRVRPQHPSVGSSGLGTSCSPSPPKSILSQSAPSDVNAYTFLRCDITDADIGSVQTSKHVLFKCTWPGCGREYSTCPAVERHVRLDHLGPRDDSSVDMSDHEEEFYYTEVEEEEEENVDTVTQTFADMQTTSPTRAFAQLPDVSTALPDHDYQRKVMLFFDAMQEKYATNTQGMQAIQQLDAGIEMSLPLSIPKSTFHQSHQYHHQESASYTTAPREVFSLPSSLPSGDMSSSGFIAWPVHRQLPHSFDSQNLQSSTSNHFMLKSSTPSASHRRSRTDVKKCRKVYGIENRAMWCTQCKWKKACNRFQEHRLDDVN